MNEEETPGVLEEAAPGVLANVDDDDDEDQYGEPYNPDAWNRLVPTGPRVVSQESTRLQPPACICHASWYSLKKGLKKFKNVGEEAVSKELMQLHMRDMLKPQSVNDLSSDHKKGALESLMFLTEKRDGTIKGRTCADGRNQRETGRPNLSYRFT
jgi:hypothetical protein